jgi:tRNA splicing ligase
MTPKGKYLGSAQKTPIWASYGRFRALAERQASERIDMKKYTILDDNDEILDMSDVQMLHCISDIKTDNPKKNILITDTTIEHLLTIIEIGYTKEGVERLKKSLYNLSSIRIEEQNGDVKTCSPLLSYSLNEKNGNLVVILHKNNVSMLIKAMNANN